MTALAETPERVRPDLRRRVTVALALFVAVTSVAGGAGIAFGPAGASYVPAPDALANTPFTGFLVPGALLALVVGGSALAAAVLAARRSRFAPDVTVLAGGALSVWILVEVAVMRAAHVLQFVHGALGLLLLVLGAVAAWRSGEARQRWVLVVTAAECVGYLAPATTGVLLARTDTGEGARTVLIVLAGCVEGLLLGAGQARAFPFEVRRGRYALLTSAGAGLVWGAVMSLMLLGQSDGVGAAGMIAAGVVVGIVGLLAIGGLQWLELRTRGPRSARWIAWTALAWTLALPLSFAPGPFVNETTPLAVHLALWGAGGLTMAYVMALVTWQGVRRLPQPPRGATAP